MLACLHCASAPMLHQSVLPKFHRCALGTETHPSTHDTPLLAHHFEQLPMLFMPVPSLRLALHIACKGALFAPNFTHGNC